MGLGIGSGFRVCVSGFGLGFMAWGYEFRSPIMQQDCVWITILLYEEYKPDLVQAAKKIPLSYLSVCKVSQRVVSDVPVQGAGSWFRVQGLGLRAKHLSLGLEIRVMRIWYLTHNSCSEVRHYGK